MPVLRPITVDGKEFRSTKTAAEFYNLNKETVSDRLSKGWTVKEALGLDPPPKYSIREYNKWLAKKGINKKLCTECKEEKSLSEFNKITNSDLAKAKCKKCLALYTKKFNLYRKFGLTQQEWNRIFESQGRKCKICGSTETKAKGKDWHTDHNHTTGKVRGILCRGCNHLLGNAEDNTEILQSATEYLNNSKKLEEIL